MLDGKHFDCSIIHDGSCIEFAFLRSLKVFKKVKLTYFLVHFLPFIFSKKNREEIKQNPVKALLKLIKNYSKSILFICLTGGMTRYLLCFLQNKFKTYDEKSTLPSVFITLFFTTFLEPASRRQEFALFIMPRFLDSFWNYLRLRFQIVKTIPYSENVIFGLAMGIIFYYYQYEEKSIKSFYRSVLKKLIQKC